MRKCIIYGYCVPFLLSKSKMMSFIYCMFRT
jgi:hypothetical protein